MGGACPCGRGCSGCPYEEICGGCLGTRCIHVKEEESAGKKALARCLFCQVHSIDCNCPKRNHSPPRQFPLAHPKVLSEAIEFYLSLESPTRQKEPAWPLLIPEVSCITETTARIGVWPDEGDWANPFWDPIAWDMTGYLFDKVKGMPWVFEPSGCGEQDWHEILGPEKNWIRNILFVDRLPDWLALQTSPTSVMVAYLNRMMTFHRKLLYDADAPQPWLLTHGYPSYIDWPPAWHFNLGIRMLSSFFEYVSSQSPGMMSVQRGALYPDKDGRTARELPLPFVRTDEGDRLLWKPGKRSTGPTEMEWPRLPGVIPFVPGADVKQITWFGRQMVRAGFRTLALDALNTIAHENFEGIQTAVTSLNSVGAQKIVVYGPWPLHIPAEHRCVRSVSYIPSASHMDLTDYPPRFWRYRPKSNKKTDTPWHELPSYKTTSLPSVQSVEWIEACDCPACSSARTLESTPRSIWRLGHLFNAGFEWVLKTQDRDAKKAIEGTNENVKLWFQGPSYTVFRDCLHHSGTSHCADDTRLMETLRFSDVGMTVQFRDGVILSQNEIRWCWDDDIHKWASGFPSLGE